MVFVCSKTIVYLWVWSCSPLTDCFLPLPYGPDNSHKITLKAQINFGGNYLDSLLHLFVVVLFLFVSHPDYPCPVPAHTVLECGSVCDDFCASFIHISPKLIVTDLELPQTLRSSLFIRLTLGCTDIWANTSLLPVSLTDIHMLCNYFNYMLAKCSRIV